MYLKLYSAQQLSIHSCSLSVRMGRKKSGKGTFLSSLPVFAVSAAEARYCTGNKPPVLPARAPAPVRGCRRSGLVGTGGGFENRTGTGTPARSLVHTCYSEDLKRCSPSALQTAQQTQPGGERGKGRERNRTSAPKEAHVPRLQEL